MTLSLSVATREDSRVALITCAELPDLDPDDRQLIDPLAARGLRAEPVVWDDANVDWSVYDLAVLRSTWDYAARRDEFVAWARRVGTRLANPPEVVAWNTDKRYLRELSAAGVAAVPTRWHEPGDPAWEPPDTGTYVVKPAVSAGSRDTERYDLADPYQRDLAVRHVARLAAAGRTTMIQPYQASVDTHGETALIYLAGRFSHAIRKGPMLAGPPDPARVEPLYRPETIAARTPTAAERELGDLALRALPVPPHRLLYARIDLLAGPDGAPLVVEAELTEPSLFLSYAAGAADAFAEAVAALVATPRR